MMSFIKSRNNGKGRKDSQSSASHIQPSNSQHRSGRSSANLYYTNILANESLRAKTNSLSQQVQTLKKSFPLLKINFEKLELELSDICLQLKKDTTKSPTKQNISPIIKSYQGNRQINRSGSLVNRVDSQETLCKAQHMVMSMAKFKQELLKRDNLIVTLVKSMTENNIEAQKITSNNYSGNDKTPNKELFPPKIDGDESILQERIKELQKFNSNLLDELEITRSQLSETRIERMKDSEIRPWRMAEKEYLSQTSIINRRGYSQTRDTGWELEKSQLNTKIGILTTELDKISKVSERKLFEIKTEHDEQTKFYSLKLAETSDCINNFLIAMQNLQTGILKQSESTTKKLQDDFETQKTQLIYLSKDLKMFEEKISINKASFRVIDSYGVVSDMGTYGSVKEIRPEVAPERKFEFRSQSVERLNESTDHSRIIEDYKKTNTFLRSHIANLDMALKKRDEDILRYRMNEDLMYNLISKLKRLENQVMESLIKANYKIDIYSKRLERLQILIKDKKVKLDIEVRDAYKLSEKSREEYKVRSNRILELEKRMICIEQSMEEERKVLENENANLKQRIIEMQDNSSNLLTTVKSKQRKLHTEKLNGLTKELEVATSQIQILKDKLAKNLLTRISFNTQFSKAFSNLFKNCENKIKGKLDNITTRINTLQKNLFISSHKPIVRGNSNNMKANEKVTLLKFARRLQQAFSNKTNIMLTTIVNKNNATLNSLETKLKSLKRSYIKQRPHVSRNVNSYKSLIEKDALIKQLEENLISVKQQNDNEIKSLYAKLSEKDTLVQEASKIIENLNSKSHSSTQKYIHDDFKAELLKKEKEIYKLKNNNIEMNKQIEKFQAEILAKEKLLQDTRKVIRDLNIQLNNSQAQCKKLTENKKSLLLDMDKEQSKSNSAKTMLMIEKLLKDYTNNIIKKLNNKLTNAIDVQKEKIVSLIKMIKKVLEKKQPNSMQIEYLSKKKSLTGKLALPLLKTKAMEMTSSVWLPIKDKLIKHNTIIKTLTDTIMKLVKQYSSLRQNKIDDGCEGRDGIQEVNDLKQQLSELKEECKKLNTLNSNIIGNVRNACSKTSEGIIECQKCFNNALLEPSKVILNIQRQVNNLNSHNTILRGRIVQFTKELKEKSELVDSQKKQLQENNRMINTIREQIELKNNEINSLRMDTENKKRQITKLTTTTGGNEGQKKLITELQTEWQNHEEKYKERIRKLESSLKEKQIIINSCKETLQSFTDKYTNQLLAMKNLIINKTKDKNTQLNDTNNKVKTLYKVNVMNSKNLLRYFTKLLTNNITGCIKDFDKRIITYNKVIVSLGLKFHSLIEITKEKHNVINKEHNNDYLNTQQSKQKICDLGKKVQNLQTSFFSEIKKRIQWKFSFIESLDRKLRLLKELYATKFNTEKYLIEIAQLKSGIANIINGLQEKDLIIQDKDEELKQCKSKVNQLNNESFNIKQHSVQSIKSFASSIKKIRESFGMIKSEIGTCKSKSNELLSQSVNNMRKLIPVKIRNTTSAQLENSQSELKRTNDEYTLLMQQMSEKLLKLQNENNDLREEIEKKSEEAIKLQVLGGTTQIKQGRINELEKRLIDSLTKVNSLSSELATEKTKSEKISQKGKTNSKELQEMRGLLEERERQFNALVITHDNLKVRYANKLQEEKIIIEKFKTLITTNIASITKSYNLIISGIETKLLGLTQVALKADICGDSQILVIVNYLREHIDDILESKRKEFANAFNQSLDNTLKVRSRILTKTRRLAQISSGQLSPSKDIKSAFTESSNALHQALLNKNAKLTKELAEQKQVTGELMTKIFAYQTAVEDTKSNPTSPVKSYNSPVMNLSKQIIDKASDEGSPQKTASFIGERKGSVSSVKTCPAPGSGMKTPAELEIDVAKHIKELAIQCLEKVPLNAIKEFDKMILPFCSMIGMNPDEQKKLYQKRKEAKIDLTPQKKSTSGLLSLLG